jgi:hypothetical protein
MGNVADPFNLQADPAAIEALEDAWKLQVEKLSWAADTINSGANRVLNGESWIGETATRYNDHRRRLVTDLDDAAELAGKVARSLGECAQLLRSSQEQLTTEKQKLAGIPADNANGTLTYRPRNDEETTLVQNAMRAATDIRVRVENGLNKHAEVFNDASNDLGRWASNWVGKKVRVLNWNIQQGGDGNNLFGGNKGTESGDIGPMAQKFINGKIDVATLQEVFKGDAEKLQAELNRRDPGGNWVVKFAAPVEEQQPHPHGQPEQPGIKVPSRRMHWDGIPSMDEMGNAVVVRQGDSLTAGGQINHDLGEKGDEPRNAVEVPITVR